MSTTIGLAAAGSGGHVFPALAVADALRGHGLAYDDVVFFGGDRMEATTVPDAGYPFVGVHIHGFRRGLSADNLTLPFVVWSARRDIAEEISRRSITAVGVFGGYIAGPAALAARARSAPVIVHEANAVPGIANRLVGRLADTVFTSFRPAAERLRGARVIGSPLRREFTDFDRSRLAPAARARYGLADDARVLGIVGGSLGADFLNRVAADLAARPDRTFSIVHLTGAAHADRVAAAAAGVPDWHPIGFEDRMVDLYAAADLIVSRGGALTVSELQATHTPAVIVPLPAGKGYQARNASDLEQAGGALVLEQGDPGEVSDAVVSLIGDDRRLGAMRAARSGIDHRLAADTMAERLLEVADA